MVRLVFLLVGSAAAGGASGAGTVSGDLHIRFPSTPVTPPVAAYPASWGNACGHNERTCLCATGTYCLAGNAMCISPYAPCPSSQPPEQQTCECGTRCHTPTGTIGVCQEDGYTCALSLLRPNCNSYPQPSWPETCECGDSCLTERGQLGWCQSNGVCQANTRPSCGRNVCPRIECPDYLACPREQQQMQYDENGCPTCPSCGSGTDCPQPDCVLPSCDGVLIPTTLDDGCAGCPRCSSGYGSFGSNENSGEQQPETQPYGYDSNEQQSSGPGPRY